MALASETPSQPKKPAMQSHDVAAEIVSVNAEAKTVTIKDAKGGTATVPVEGEAVARLKQLVAGDQVTMTCRDNDKGEHQAVSKITKRAKAA
jgi:hypothetical protein